MIDFDTFITDAIAARPVEARIIRKVVRALRAAGDPVVSVWDGEESMPVSTERDVLRTVFNLDDATLYTQSGGWVLLVMGNGWDLIADHTLTLSPVLDPVTDWVTNHPEYV